MKVNVTQDGLMALANWIIKIYMHSDDFSKLAGEIVEVIVKKNHDYGDAWQRYGIFTPLIRLNDKMLRVKTLAGGEEAMVADEAVADTLRDIVAYGLLGLLWLRSNRPIEPITTRQLSLFGPEAILKTIAENDDTKPD